ncbi:hypothetical protein H7X69_02220 [Candidatus Saccharibacteria bacterium]|nr:hypothetical protein [Candidatus Saccharibacteria bacterium]
MEPNRQLLTPQDELNETEPAAEQDQTAESAYFNEETFKQPEQTTDLPESAETANTFSSMPQDNLPENEINTPLPTIQTVVTSTTPIATVEPETVVESPKKKSLLWLWLTLGAILMIAAGLMASFFVAKNAADTTARTYTSSVKSYLDDVYDAATSAATNPSDVQKAIEVVKAPILATTPLQSVSSDYTAAEKLQTEVTGKVDTLVEKIKGYDQVHAFYADYKALYSDLRTLDSTGAAAITLASKPLISVYLSSFRNKLEEVRDLSTNATVPDELRTNIADIGRVFGEMHTSWSAMVSAFDSANENAYDVAYTNYKKSNSELSEVEQPIIKYVDTLSSKIRDSAKELQGYGKTLK